jgi:hypothetical protein
MAITLTVFQDMVRSEIKRGSTVDAEIRRAARQAVLWLERNNSFKYMERYDTYTLLANTASINMSPGGGVLAATERLRKPLFIRHVSSAVLNSLSAEESSLLRQVDPLDFGQIDTASRPKNFYISGRHTFKLVEYSTTESYDLEIGSVVYTDWSSVTPDTFAPDVFELYEDVVLAQTMVMLAPTVRMDERQLTRWIGIRDQALHTALAEDEDLRQSMRSEIMSYEGRNA